MGPSHSYGLSLLGGVLIGLGASLVHLLHGRIAGVSGLFGGVFLPRSEARDLRIAFVGGLAVAGLALAKLYPAAFPSAESGAPSLLVVAAAGGLVGYGTRLGGGCTSGHGVCGVSRMSLRSVVATGAFMVTGMLTVLVVSRFLGGGR